MNLINVPPYQLKIICGKKFRGCLKTANTTKLFFSETFMVYGIAHHDTVLADYILLFKKSIIKFFVVI